LSEQEEIREAVDAAKAPSKFNIVDVLNNRAYPEAVVSIVIDEALSYEAAMIKEQIEELELNISDSKSAKIEDLILKRDEISKKLSESSYKVHIRGISEGQREESYNDARKKYPVEYESSNNISDMLAGNSTRVEKESTQRDTLFTDYLWQKHIVKIVNPDGDEQEQLAFNTVRTMRDSFPLSATMKINEAIEKLRTSTAVFMMETGEDFLAKP